MADLIVGQKMTKQRYILDGSDFSTLEEFFDRVSSSMIPGASWGKNLEAFNDILRGGFGTADSGFVIEWRNSEVSKLRLGYEETARQLEIMTLRCHPSNRDSMFVRLTAARERRGDTAFDWLVEIIQIHCAGGAESEDQVQLDLI